MWTARSWIFEARRGGIYIGHPIVAAVSRGWSGRCRRARAGWMWGTRRARSGQGVRGRVDGRGWKGREHGGSVDFDGRVDGAHEAQTGGQADWAVGASSMRTAGRTGGRTDRRGGGPTFKRRALLHPISISHTQSACLVREQVCRVPGSAMGSKRMPTIKQSYYPKRAQTHLPCLSASVWGAEKGILLSGYKNGFNRWRWQRNTKSEASNPCSRGQGWRWGQEKA